jgi:hypothetical protein
VQHARPCFPIGRSSSLGLISIGEMSPQFIHCATPFHLSLVSLIKYRVDGIGYQRCTQLVR